MSFKENWHWMIPAVCFYAGLQGLLGGVAAFVLFPSPQAFGYGAAGSGISHLLTLVAQMLREDETLF